MAAATPLRELQRSTSTKHAIVAHGQLCAVLAAATGAGASMLAASGVNAPTAQSSFVYAILALIYADDASDTAPGPLVWLAIAIFDVEGNYLVVKAFQHTSMTSVMLLDCFAIPCVLVLSKFALDAQFTRLHLVGAAACVVGAALTVFSDVLPPPWGAGGGAIDLTPAPHPLVGDALCMAGAALYAASNVMQEYLVRDLPTPGAFLGRLGVAGFCVSVVQAAVLEHRQIAEAFWILASDDPQANVYLVIFIGTMVALYTLTAEFMSKSDAAFYNLNLLASDAWAILFSALVARALPPPLYFVALLAMVAGVVTYHSRPSPTAPPVLGRARTRSAGSGTDSPLLSRPPGVV